MGSFQKRSKAYKKIRVIKKSIAKKTFEKKIIEKENRRTFDFIDLEDNDQKKFQMDKNTIRKIKSGKIRISSILDLHSFTLKESKEKVIKFIERNFLYGNILNLIITGKGKRLSVSDGWKGDGKLKKNVPIWLSSTYLSKYILWFDIASPEKGGNGALFVYLKKAKE